MRRMKLSRSERWEDSLAWAERKTALEAWICPMQAAAGRWAINHPRHPESCHRLQDPSGIAIGKKTNTRVMEMASLLLAAVEERKMIHQERKKPRSIPKKKGTKIRLVKRYPENTMDMKLLRN